MSNATKGSDNIFEDLGFPVGESAVLLARSALRLRLQERGVLTEDEESASVELLLQVAAEAGLKPRISFA